MPRTDFSAERFDWAKRFTPHAIEILGTAIPQHGRFATDSEDLTEATDFVLLRSRDVAAAMRVRHHWALAYGDVTFRRTVATGTRTELEKVLEGAADFMVYGFARWDGAPRMCAYTVLDLHAFRRYYAAKGERWRQSDATTTDQPSSPTSEPNSDRLL